MTPLWLNHANNDIEAILAERRESPSPTVEASLFSAIVTTSDRIPKNHLARELTRRWGVDNCDVMRLDDTTWRVTVVFPKTLR